MRALMQALPVLFAFAALSAPGTSAQQQPFSIKDVMSAPYALGLTASPVGARFAWVENAEGVRNIWVAGTGEAARQITHYTEDDGQDIAGMAWSADGALIAYPLGAENGAGGKPANPAELQRNTAVAVWVADVAGKTEPARVGEGRAPLFAPDGRLLFVRSGQIWVAEPDGKRSVVTDAKQRGGESVAQLVFDRGSAGGLTLSPDGKLLAYVSRRHGHSFIGLYEFATKTLRFVSPSTGNDSAPSFSPDGKELAWLREPFTEASEFAANRVSAYPWSVQVASLSDLQAKTVYQPEPNKRGSVIPRFATGSPRVWWAAGGKLLFCSEADGWVHLYAMVPGSRDATAVLLTPGEFEVEDVSVGRNGDVVLYASNSHTDNGFSNCTGPLYHPFCGTSYNDVDDDRRHLWKIDLRAKASVPALVTPGVGIETRPTLSADGAVTAALASDDRQPMHPVLVASDGKMSDLQPRKLPTKYPQAALITPQQALFPTNLNVPVAGAIHPLRIHAQLFDSWQEAGFTFFKNLRLRTPNRKGDRPAIIFFHGGPKRQMLLGYPAMDYYSNAYAMNQYLASQGYIVLSVNYRCGIGYGLEFRQCEHSGADGASEYNDALAAVEYLRSRGDVDMKRVGIWGGSYGGYFTALGLARNSDLFAAGVDFHGVHDWTKEDNAPSDWLKGTNAEVDEIAKRAVASSPIADVAKWTSPVLLIHGDDDPEVAFNQTPLLADALRARGVHVEELIFPDEVHGFLLHKDWVKAYEAEADFFVRELKDRPLPAPRPTASHQTAWH